MPTLTDTAVENATAQMQRAQENYMGEIERNLRQLFRGDGQPKYAPAEHAEREKAIREAAAELRGRVLALHMETAEAAIAEGDRQIALLTGGDRLATLTGDDAARASVRRAFIQEDSAQPAYKLQSRIAAVVAAGDTVEALLFARYLGRRLESEQLTSERQAINTLLEQLSPLTTDPKAKDQRAAAQALKERGRKLRFAVWNVTREENVQAQMQRMKATGAFTL